MTTTLDDVDLRILTLLQHDARLTTKEVADKVGKSVSPVYERIKRLEHLGIIRKYVAILDHHSIDRDLIAYTHIHLKDHSDEHLTHFEQQVTAIPEVMECYNMSGEFDYLVKVAVKNMEEYHVFILHKLARVANLGKIQSFFVLRESKRETAYKLECPSLQTKKRTSPLVPG